MWNNNKRKREEEKEKNNYYYNYYNNYYYNDQQTILGGVDEHFVDHRVNKLLFHFHIRVIFGNLCIQIKTKIKIQYK